MLYGLGVLSVTSEELADDEGCEDDEDNSKVALVAADDGGGKGANGG